MTICLVSTHLHLFGAVAFIAGPNIIALGLHHIILAARNEWQLNFERTIETAWTPTLLFYCLQLLYVTTILRMAYVIRYPYKDGNDRRHRHLASSIQNRAPLPDNLDDIRSGNCRLARDDPDMFATVRHLLNCSTISFEFRRLLYRHPQHADMVLHIEMENIPQKTIRAAAAALLEHRASTETLDPLYMAVPRYQRLHLQAVCIFFAQCAMCAVWKIWWLEGLPEPVYGKRSWSIGEAMMPGAWSTILAGAGLVSYLVMIDGEQDRLFDVPPPVQSCGVPIFMVAHLHLALVTFYGVQVAMVFKNLLWQLKWMRYVIFVLNIAYLTYAFKKTVCTRCTYVLLWLPFFAWIFFTTMHACFDISFRYDP